MRDVREVAGLVTKRLYMRPVKRGDRNWFGVMLDDKGLAEMMPGVASPFGMEDAREMEEMLIEKNKKGERLAMLVADRDNEGMIGGATVYLKDREAGSCEVGCWVVDFARRRGLGEEILKTLIGYCFEELKVDRVFAHALTKNKASIGMLGKVGMKQEGGVRKNVQARREKVDIVYYGILKGEYKERAWDDVFEKVLYEEDVR